jgi:aldose 1-epimerase
VPAAHPQPPAGAQHRLVHGDHEAWITEAGATLRAYRVGSLELVDGFGPDEHSTGGRGQLLVPWPNRIRDGRYTFGGPTHQLPLTEPVNRTAIHGLTRWQSWTVESASADGVVLTTTVHAQPGYPFVLRADAAYRLTDAGLSVTLGAVNVGAVACPFGAGAHPYLRLDTGRIDELELTVPADTRYVTDDQSIPVGTEGVHGTDFDFRGGRRIGDTRLDTAYRDLRRDGDGWCRVRLSSSSGAAVALAVDPAFDHLMVFTGDTAAEVERRRRGLAVEPMTCPPNAFQHEGSYRVLEPGERMEATFTIGPA